LRGFHFIERESIKQENPKARSLFNSATNFVAGVAMALMQLEQAIIATIKALQGKGANRRRLLLSWGTVLGLKTERRQLAPGVIWINYSINVTRPFQFIICS